VLAYWRKKRAARGKPLLRRLQAPTSSSDTNPFNVFRRGAAHAFACLFQSWRAASAPATRIQPAACSFQAQNVSCVFKDPL
jgi:hypothetical protein